MNSDAVETFARIALALALLASYKIGHGGGLHQVRQRLARAARSTLRPTRDAGGRGSSPSPGPLSRKDPGSVRERRRAWLREVASMFWIALLLFAIVYATLRGEFAFSDLDRARLLAEF